MKIALNNCLLNKNSDYEITNNCIQLNIKHKFTNNLILKAKSKNAILEFYYTYNK